LVRAPGLGFDGQYPIVQDPSTFPIAGSYLENDALIERFRREVKAAARLASHPNIVAAYDAEQAVNLHFLVMEFVDGVDLARLVKSKGPLPIGLACGAVKHAAEGLEHAYQCGMVHRDIKPQNLMRTPDGRVKILDFGLARFASEALPDLLPAKEQGTGSVTEATTGNAEVSITLTNMLLGTADYIAPEQASAPRSADIRADIYSLGCTLYYLLTGQTPFTEGTLIQKIQAHQGQLPRPLNMARTDIPPELALVVDRMMAKDRSRRFQRPAEVAEALAPFANANESQGLDSNVQVATEREDRANPTPSAPTAALADRPRHEPSFRSPTGRSPRRVKVVLILAGLIGCVEFIWWEAPGLYVAGWPTPLWWLAAHLALLFGGVAFVWVGAEGWHGVSRLALLIGCVGFIRMEPPGLIAAAILALCSGAAWAFGIISFRQLACSLIALFIGGLGYVGFFWMGESGRFLDRRAVLLVAWMVSLGIIAFRKTISHTLVYFSIFGVTIATITFSWNYWVPTKVNGEGILLIENDIPLLVRSPVTGRLLSLGAREGNLVERGEVIATISQSDLRDAIHEAESELTNLQQEDEDLARIEARERQTEEGHITRLKQEIARAPDDSLERSKLTQKLSELEQNQVSVENSRQRAQLERRGRLKNLETKLSFDREKLARSTTVISNVHGRVGELLAAQGALVHEGTPLVLLHSPRGQPGTIDSNGRPFDSIIFAAPGEGRMMLGDAVEVVPATVKREQDGYIRGRVVAIGELRATKSNLEEVVGHSELADAILKRHAPEKLLRIFVKLEEVNLSGSEQARSARGNRFVWSSTHGFTKRLKTGTPCQATIVVERRRLITLIAPWTRQIVGIY
jgi:serine/threonine protein kinase/multidrug efflux pump subunit AcrA (membrane-fusion protein)